MLRGYIKPRSVTFLAGLAMVAGGLAQALAAGWPETMGPVGAVAVAAFDGQSPGLLISTGLGLIGLRRAVGE